MKISRRLFLKYCGASSLVIAGCGVADSGDHGLFGSPESLASALPPGEGAKVIWLIGSGCTGCSVSFLNRFATTAPETAADVLMDVAVVGYHPSLMAAAGDQAVAAAESFYALGGGSYILVVEGAVPTAFGGAAGMAWRSASGTEVTIQDAVKRYATNATAVVCIGTCAAFGGVGAASPNPSGVKGVSSVIGQNTINVPGCPPHPDWIVAGLAKVLSNNSITLDSLGRPRDLFGLNLHESCPRNPGGSTQVATTYGIDQLCLRQLGCRGPITNAQCSSHQWNSGRNWCVDANAPCVGCTEPTFPQVGLQKPV
jgi:hydrogenase small subunit